MINFLKKHTMNQKFGDTYNYPKLLKESSARWQSRFRESCVRTGLADLAGLDLEGLGTNSWE